MKKLKLFVLLLGSLILPLNNIKMLNVKASDFLYETITDYKRMSWTVISGEGNSTLLNRVGYFFNVDESVDVSEIKNVKFTYKTCNFYFIACIGGYSNHEETLFSDQNVNFGTGLFSIPNYLGNSIPQVESTSHFVDFYNQYSNEYTIIFADGKQFNISNLLEQYDYYVLFDHEQIFDVINITITYINSVGQEETETCIGSNCNLGDNSSVSNKDHWQVFLEWIMMWLKFPQQISQYFGLFVAVVLFIIFHKPIFFFLKKLLSLIKTLTPLVYSGIRFFIYILWNIIKSPFVLLDKIFKFSRKRENNNYLKSIRSNNYYKSSKRKYRRRKFANERS